MKRVYDFSSRQASGTDWVGLDCTALAQHGVRELRVVLGMQCDQLPAVPSNFAADACMNGWITEETDR